MFKPSNIFKYQKHIMIYHLPKSPPTRPSLPGCCEGRDQSRARGRCGDQEVGGSMLRAVSAAVGNLSHGVCNWNNIIDIVFYHWYIHIYLYIMIYHIYIWYIYMMYKYMIYIYIFIYLFIFMYIYTYTWIKQWGYFVNTTLVVPAY